jgi:uncharacterized protein
MARFNDPPRRRRKGRELATGFAAGRLGLERAERKEPGMTRPVALSAAKIHGIFRYPVKGLSPEPLASAQLAVGATLPADRLYAIENGPSGFDAAAPQHQPKQRYLMLMRNERLALLRTRFDENSHILSIGAEGREPVRGDLRTAAGRTAVERFFATYCADELRGPPKVLHAPWFSFSDIARKAVSIINLASVAAIEEAIGTAVDPLRFRANLYVTGWRAWHELDLIGEELAFTRPESRYSSASSAARRSTSTRRPGSAIYQSPRS